MQAAQLLHKTFQKNNICSHKTRLKNVLICAETVIKEKKATLTLVGRRIKDKDDKHQNQVRSNIRKVDRLLGSKHLHSELSLFYKNMTALLIPKLSVAWIHVDWTCLSSENELYLLRASLSVKGRSITLYKEVHPKKNENNHSVHKDFLRKLNEILPEKTRPIIVTDAGFRAIWFEEVIKHGWNFVGRVRNKNLVLLEKEKTWKLSKTLYKKASHNPKLLGSGLLTKKNRLECNFVVYKSKLKKRKKKNKDKSNCTSSKSKKYSKANREPWLIVTSLKKKSNLAKKTVGIYRERMQIEENFRDTKSQRYGFGLNESGTKTVERMSVLALIVAIASFISWVAGTFVRNKGDAPKYQAHSAKFTTALSIVYLGCEALRKSLKITEEEFFMSIKFIVEHSSKEVKLCA